jgi:putative Mn2+ efflux pump MntP
MTLFTMIALVLPLGLDTLAVSAALGIGGVSAGQRMRASLLFPAFEAVMPLVGLAIGHGLGAVIGTAANYAAIGVLLALGIHILVVDEDEREHSSLIGRGLSASIGLGLLISLDELAIGFTLGLLHLPVLPVIALIALQTLILAQVGMRVGKGIGDRLRERAERLAGVALALLAIGLLIARLAG